MKTSTWKSPKKSSNAPAARRSTPTATRTSERCGPWRTSSTSSMSSRRWGGNVKSSWTDADFGDLSWHDCSVHALRIVEGPHGAGELILDLDYSRGHRT